MKELSIEEKAKRYDEAIEIAKKINNEQRAQPFNVMTKVFPELAESEDERVKESITEFFKNYSENGTWKAIPDVTKWIAWLEKQGEQKPAWSEQDRKMLDVIIECIKYLKSREERDKEAGIKLTFIKSYTCIINWLKSLKDRCVPQPKQEWNKEDEKNIEVLCALVYEDCGAEDASRLISWLKSLRPQNTWKPSDGQMEALEYAVKPFCKGYGWDETPLGTLFNDLKKLKG